MQFFQSQICEKIMSYTFGLHQSDLLDLSLENQESVVVEVNPFGPEKLGHLLELTATSVNLVVRRVVLGGCPRDHQLGIGNRTEPILLRIIVDNLLKVNLKAERKRFMISLPIYFYICYTIKRESLSRLGLV